MRSSAGVALALALLGCSEDQPDAWRAIVYPDARDLVHEQVIGEYPTLNECLDVAIREAGPRGSYECGLNCRGDNDGLLVCERTVGNER